MEMQKKQQIERINPSIIKTPQSIIHIKHNVSLLAYKHWVLLLQDLREQMEADTPTEAGGVRFISMAKLSEHLGYTPSKKDLWECFRSLKNQDLAINFLDKDGHKAKYGAGFISEWSISSNRIGYKFPSFLELVMSGSSEEAKQIFQLLNWNIFNSFSGKYEAIIYKLCKDYIGIGRTPYMTIEDYREYIGLTDGEYVLFKELNRWTISKPISSINKSEISDITVSVEFKKNGRNVAGLWFKAELKKQIKLPFEEFKPHPAFDYAKVSISAEEQTQYLERYTPEQVQAIIDRANEYGDELKGKGKQAKLGGIYKTAFAEGWGLDRIEQKKAEKLEQEQQENKQKQQQAQEMQSKKKEQLEQEAVKQKIIDFEGLPEAEKNAFMMEMLAQVPSVLKPNLERLYSTHGTNAHRESASFMASLRAFIVKKEGI
jgi:hypothetical protein